MKVRPPVIVLVIIVLLAAAAGGYYYFKLRQPAEPVALTASGSVESTTVTIAPEISGRVTEVTVEAGQSVKAGDVLFRLDDSLLKVQRDVAAAAMDSAKAAADTAQAAVASAQQQVDVTRTSVLAEDAANRTALWKESKETDFDQSSWYFTRAEQYTALQAEAETAAKGLTDAQDNLAFVEQKATSGDFVSAEKRLTLARVSYQTLQTVLDKTNGASDGQALKDQAQNLFDDAKTELDDAQQAYDDALTTEGAQDVLDARAKLQVAQEHSDIVADKLRALETGLLSPRLTTAQKNLEQVTTAAAQAQTAINQADANLKLIDAQLARYVVYAPADGVILSRNVEPGEVVSPGAVLLSLGRLTDLTLTVYVSEDQYGSISLGQAVDIVADSFSGEVFAGTVQEISNTAEFTPRNVQTTDGRKTTVFAIKLRVDDPSGKLKPGMPADVTFK